MRTQNFFDEDNEELRIESHHDTIDDIPKQWRDRILYFGRLQRICDGNEDIDARLIKDKETKLWGYIRSDKNHCGEVFVEIKYVNDMLAMDAFNDLADKLSCNNKSSCV